MQSLALGIDTTGLREALKNFQNGHRDGTMVVVYLDHATIYLDLQFQTSKSSYLDSNLYYKVIGYNVVLF